MKNGTIECKICGGKMYQVDIEKIGEKIYNVFRCHICEYKDNILTEDVIDNIEYKTEE